jgi:hypothetical protein
VIITIVALYLIAGLVCIGFMGIDSTIARTSTFLGGALVFILVLVFWPMALLAFFLEDPEEEEGI